METASQPLTEDTPLICAHTELPVAPWRVSPSAGWPWRTGESCPCGAHEVLAVSAECAHLFERAA